MPDKAKKAPKNAQNKPKKAVKIPNPPEYFCGYSLKKWKELACLRQAFLSLLPLIFLYPPFDFQEYFIYP